MASLHTWCLQWTLPEGGEYKGPLTHGGHTWEELIPSLIIVSFLNISLSQKDSADIQPGLRPQCPPFALLSLVLCWRFGTRKCFSCGSLIYHLVLFSAVCSLNILQFPK